MEIPIVDLRAQFETLRKDMLESVRRVFETQRFILGPEVEALEAGVAALSGSRHAIGCASGSDAILLAIAALQDPHGIDEHHLTTPLDPLDGASAREAPEVVTTPFTFFASAGSVVHAGARPRFVDIEPLTYGLDPSRLAAALSSRTIAVLPIHLFGQPCDLDEVSRAAGDVPVVEDAAQAIGATLDGPNGPRVAGSIGLMGCLSFFPTKNLGGAGDGGMILTSDDALAERLRKIRAHGGRQMYHHETVGWNSRLDEIQAAVLNVKLPHLAAWSEARASLARRYDGLLAEAGLVSRGLVLPPVRKPDRTHIFHQYVVRVPRGQGTRDRDGLRTHLSAAGIATGVYYPVPLHLQPCFRNLGHARGDFPVSERAAEEVLALPIYPELHADSQNRVAHEIATYFGLGSR